MQTNREHFKNTPLREVESAYMDSWRKGFNKGFSSWLVFPYYEKQMHTENGRLMMKGKEHKGHLYTNEEYAEYARLGMLP